MKKNSEDVEQRLRHKPVILEGFQTAQRSKKPKKKEMSAREKRIRGIYNISPKGQRLGFSLIYACCRLAWFSDGQRALSSFYLIQLNPALLTPHYYEQFFNLCPGEMSCNFFVSNQLNVDTLLIWTPMSVLMGFDCVTFLDIFLISWNVVYFH